MPILIVGIAQAKALMLDLASPAASKREKGRITTYPLLTTRRFDQWRLGITTKPTMLAGNRLGFHAIVSHGLSWFGGGELNPPSYRTPIFAVPNRRTFFTISLTVFRDCGCFV
jgi:hemolysin activation/secretion protein